MPRIQAIGLGVPQYCVPQRAVQDMVAQRFAAAFPEIQRYLTIFRHAQIDTRYLVRPLEWWHEPRSFAECNAVFIEAALDLSCQAIEACLQPLDLTPNDIDHIVVVTTTGLAAPSLDALLMQRLGMRPQTRRTPIWGLGCAGGLGGLNTAFDYLRAEPTQRVLLLNVEFCSLTYLADDFSKRNLIATSLFGDGVTAVLLEGDQVNPRNQAFGEIVATRSHLYPDSAEIMGWNIVNSGFEVVFSSRIPSIVREQFRPLLDEFLAQHGLNQADLGQYLLHPGGAKVVQAYQESLQLSDADLAVSRDVLRSYGNMSSATIFFVLQQALAAKPLAKDEFGLLAVFGPGFSAELGLIRGV